MTRQQAIEYVTAVIQVTGEPQVVRDAVRAAEAMIAGDGMVALEVSGRVMDAIGIDLVNFI